MEKIQEFIEQRIRQELNAYHGVVELMEITSDGFVKVRLTGACAACPSGRQTISEELEAAIKPIYPENKGIILMQQVSDDLIHQALKILRRDRS